MLAEDSAFAFSKASEDIAAALDTASRDVGKPANDTAGAADSAARSLSKPASDAFTADDLFSRQVSFNRTFNDLVNATDDIDGIASIEDDQEVSFFKFTNDSLSFADAASKDSSKPLADVMAAQDLPAKSVNKPFADSASLTDATALLADKNLLEIAGAQDVITRKSIDKSSTDVAGAADVAARDLSKSVSDASLLSDTSHLATGKGISDTATFSDVIYWVLVFLRSPTDEVALADVKALALSKPSADAMSVSDSSFRRPELGKTDSVGVASSGTLRSQGYCDFSYFAEDYVGSSRSFT